MINIVAIFIGGGLGAVLRYCVGILATKYVILSFPFATLLVNIIGGFFIGFLYMLCLDKVQINQTLNIALTVGFCGGLTTFSTFSLELFKMFNEGSYFLAVIYVILSVLACFGAVVLGIYLAKCF